MTGRTASATRVVLTAVLMLAASGSVGCATAGESSPAAAPHILVSAAGSLKAPFEQIADEFTAQTGIAVDLNSAASGVLQRQIEEGAPVDVFASASPRQMDALVEGDFIAAEEISDFASNRIVLVVPTGNPAAITSPADLGRAARVATGNPETAPHGTHAFEVLVWAGLLDTVAPRLILAENSAQTFDYVTRGEVDAALGFASEALGREGVEVVWTAPAEAHTRVRYVIAPVSSRTDDVAARFIEFVTGVRGAAILRAHGFVVDEVP